MNQGALLLITCSAGVIALGSGLSLAFELLFGRRRQINRRINDEFYDRVRHRARNSPLFKDLAGTETGAALALQKLQAPLQEILDQSGMTWTIEGVLWRAAAAAAAGAALGTALAAHWLGALLGLIAGAAAPFAWLLIQRRRRHEKICQQLPEAFELMTRAIRAGQTMNTAFQLVAQEGRPPLSEEFAYCAEQQNLGLSPEVTLRDLARRNNVMELQMFVVALLVQRQSGGNPAELLHNLSSVIRKRMRLTGRMKALTGEGRMQAVVLSILPIIAFAALLVFNRQYAQILLARPMLLGGVLLSELCGALWIRRIVKADF